MRLFIASPVIIDAYTNIKADFEGIIEGRWVEDENLHLTWVFLGETDDPKPAMEKLAAIRSLSRSVESTELGYFGRPPRVFFAKAESKLLYDKAQEFKEAGFELYRFKPHITLCRIKHIHNYKAYKEILKSYRKKRVGTVLPQIHLYKSELTSAGPIHTKLM